MSDTSDPKKRKTEDMCDKPASKKTLFILLCNNFNRPDEIENKYVIFTSGKNVDVYNKLCNALLADMKKASKGYHDVTEAERTWVPWMMFLCYNSAYGDKEKADGYDDEEDYQKTRNQKARQVMMPIGMIRSIEDYTKDAVGSDFIKEEIGDFKFASVRDVMDAGSFANVMFVPSACNRECMQYYKKLEK